MFCLNIINLVSGTKVIIRLVVFVLDFHRFSFSVLNLCIYFYVKIISISLM